MDGINDQATDLRNYVAKHGKADAPAKSPERLDLEFNVTTLGFDMYEVMRMSDDTLQRIWNLYEARWK